MHSPRMTAGPGPTGKDAANVTTNAQPTVTREELARRLDGLAVLLDEDATAEQRARARAELEELRRDIGPGRTVRL